MLIKVMWNQRTLIQPLPFINCFLKVVLLCVLFLNFDLEIILVYPGEQCHLICYEWTAVSVSLVFFETRTDQTNLYAQFRQPCQNR